MPSVIFLSSQEALIFVERICAQLTHNHIKAESWKKLFGVTDSFLESLQKILRYDYAIAVLAKDDISISKGKRMPCARDNVIFELGLAISKLGKRRAIILEQDGVKIPSDLSGIVPISFTDENFKNENVDDIVCQIKSHINDQHIDRPPISWDDENVKGICLLCEKVMQTHSMGGFQEVEAIIGIQGGGLLTTDLFIRGTKLFKPTFILFKDRGNKDIFGNDINQITITQLKIKKIKKILLIDNLIRSGNTIIQAKEYLKKKLGKTVIIKTAVAMIDNQYENKDEIDYKGLIGDFIGRQLVLSR